MGRTEAVWSTREPPVGIVLCLSRGLFGRLSPRSPRSLPPPPKSCWNFCSHLRTPRFPTRASGKSLLFSCPFLPVSCWLKVCLILHCISRRRVPIGGFLKPQVWLESKYILALDFASPEMAFSPSGARAPRSGN